MWSFATFINYSYKNGVCAKYNIDIVAIFIISSWHNENTVAGLYSLVTQKDVPVDANYDPNLF